MDDMPAGDIKEHQVQRHPANSYAENSSYDVMFNSSTYLTSGLPNFLRCIAFVSLSVEDGLYAHVYGLAS